ncbi:MAG: VanZ family protein [candidate division Zixibacteria bacterium]|nr:VanZ family protein [candidate division Zixibacteria bacterium]
MRIVRLVICLGYWALLSVLLLVPDPAAVVPLPEVPAFLWGDVGLHFGAFAVLALLTYAARWPQPPGGLLVVLLLAYGTATELLQSLVPCRAVAIEDCVGNLLGILIATGVYRLAQRAVQRLSNPAARKATGNPNPGS